MSSPDPIAAAISATPVGPMPVSVRSATSRAGYQRMCDEGLLAPTRLKVYTALFLHGPLTRNELNAVCHRLFGPQTQYDKRLAEMERLGVLGRCGERACRITTHTCDLWDVTAHIPDAPTGDDDSEPPPPPIVGRPEPADLEGAVQDLRGLLADRVDDLTPRLLHLLQWLAQGAKNRRKPKAGEAPAASTGDVQPPAGDAAAATTGEPAATGAAEGASAS